MTLGWGLVDAEGVGHRMAGLLPVDTRFDRRALSLGYRRLRLRAALPRPSRLAGHEFHYATLGSPPPALPVPSAEDRQPEPACRHRSDDCSTRPGTGYPVVLS